MPAKRWTGETLDRTCGWQVLKQSARTGSSILAIALLAGCANAPPRPVDDQVLVRTDPDGATCTLLQSGVLVAEVATTPAVATVPRRRAPLDIVCRKPGYAEASASLPHEFADVIDAEAGVRRPRTAGLGELSLGVAGNAALSAGIPVSGGGGGWLPSVDPSLRAGGSAASSPFPAGPGIGVALAVVGLAVYVSSDASYGYRTPPAILLAPGAFASRSDCDRYFSAWRSRVEDAARAAIERIDRECRPWPCGIADARCPNPACEAQRANVQAELAHQLHGIAALLDRAAIVP